jgi:hypothetical protein
MATITDIMLDMMLYGDAELKIGDKKRIFNVVHTLYFNST